MTLANVIDSRTQKYLFRRINAVLEPTYNDNSCDGADQSELSSDIDFVCLTKDDISVSDAVRWANHLPGEVALYLYDLDTNDDDGGADSDSFLRAMSA